MALTWQLENWGKSVQTSPAVYVLAQTVEEVQKIAADEAAFPGPVRASGAALSVTACHSNDGGTTIGMQKLNRIIGLCYMEGPAAAGSGGKLLQSSESTTTITTTTTATTTTMDGSAAAGAGANLRSIECVEAQAGVTLAQLQSLLDGHGLELAFCAEIGSATLGGVCFATTKDSSIGPACPSGGLGDFQSGLMSITVVDELGNLQEHRLFGTDGQQDASFQTLLGSQGTQGIAVSMRIAVRPFTPMITTLHVLGSLTAPDLVKELQALHADAASTQGNIFAVIDLTKGLTIVEHRTPSEGKVPARVSLSRLIRLSQKKRSFQRSYMSTADVFEYPQDVPTSEHRLAFSYYSFDLDAFQEVVQEGLEWVSEYKSKTGFSPSGFAVYFVTTSGRRTKFSFDPLYHDDKWALFVQMFSAWACAKGGRPALNQTVGIEKYPEWGASVRCERHAQGSLLLRVAFFDAKDQDTSQTPATHTPDSPDSRDTADTTDNQDAADTIGSLLLRVGACISSMTQTRLRKRLTVVAT
ncbi:unnamed protein product [Polarella glacialis]|uniref:FAD-binding PCMH-type domain-containing protein n=1 Tax=Polarella glacialis TaxID=89957 RepID=A0A813F6Z4_POLGL|nr:unnamed protein product [Polarella glacialis]